MTKVLEREELCQTLIDATCDVFESMLFLTAVSKGAITDENKLNYRSELSGIISFVGDLSGSVIFSLNNNAAMKVASSMLGEEITEINEEVEDAVGEITNMVAGGFKTRISNYGIDFNISIPTVIQGQNYTISHFPKSDYEYNWLPFSFDDKECRIELCLRK
ncbi:MAG: chemotaxis protein CheX [bacterium]